MSFSEFPAPEITLEQVLDVILRTEQLHRVVWTAEAARLDKKRIQPSRRGKRR